MPCILKVRISGIRDFNAFEKSEVDSLKYVEVTLGETKQRTKFNINRHTDDLNLSFRLEIADDSELQTCPLKITIDDVENINSGYIQIDFSFFYFHDNLKLEGWFPLYDSLAGLKGELYCTIKWEFFEEKNPYNDNSADVLLLGTTSFPKNSPYYIEQIINFAHELKIVNDPEYDWKDLIRSNRNSNEARCDVIQNSFMETRKIIGKKAKLLGGNAIIGYQEHLNLEGGTTNKICIRIIGTVVKLGVKNLNDPHYATPGGNRIIKNILRNNELLRQNSLERNKEMKLHKRDSTLPNSTFNFVDVILLTIDSLPNSVKYTYGGLVAAKSVKVLHQRLTEQHRDEWLLEIRDEIKSNATFLSCNVILGYKEDTYIFNDVIILFCYGTAISVMSSFFQDDKIIPYANSERHRHHSSKGGSSNAHRNSSCVYLHYASDDIERNTVLCRVCNEAPVPKILISSASVPQNLAVIGNGFLISAFVVYPLKKNYGEHLASEISEIFPFLELNLHKQIICKLLVNGFNSMFDYNLKLCFNQNYLFGYCCGTGMCMYGTYSENKFLIKSNYKDNFYIRNKSISARELKIIYDNLNYRSFFCRNKSLLSPVFIQGDMVQDSDGRLDPSQSYKNKLMNLSVHDMIEQAFSEQLSIESTKRNTNGHEQSTSDKIKCNNYFRLREIYLKEEEELLNYPNESDHLKRDNGMEHTQLGIKERKRIKKKKEKKKAKRVKNKGYIYEVEDHLDNITLLNIYEDSIALYNYIFNLDVNNYLANKRYDSGALPSKGTPPNGEKQSGKKVQNVTQGEKERPTKEEFPKEELSKGEALSYGDNLKIMGSSQLKTQKELTRQSLSHSNGEKRSSDPHSDARSQVDRRSRVERESLLSNVMQDHSPYGTPTGTSISVSKSNEEKKLSALFLPDSRSRIVRSCNRSFALDRSENTLPFDGEFRKGGIQDNPKYFFYMCTLDILPSIRFETFYDQQDGRTGENKVTSSWEEGNKADANSGKANQMTIPIERKREFLIGSNSPRGTMNSCIMDFISKGTRRGERQRDSKESVSNEGRGVNMMGPLLHKERDDLFSDQWSDQVSEYPTEGCMDLVGNKFRKDHGEVTMDKLVSLPRDNPPTERRILTDEEERRKKKTKKKAEKKNKNKGKHTYLNNLSKSYLYLIKRINLFSENNEQVDVVYEKINKAFNDLYNVLIFYIFANKMCPCCIYSIKYHFAFISVDVLEIMLTGHLVKIKNNNSISLELKSMNRLMQENLLKHFFNYLENYYIEKWQLFFNSPEFFSPTKGNNKMGLRRKNHYEDDNAPGREGKKKGIFHALVAKLLQLGLYFSHRGDGSKSKGMVRTRTGKGKEGKGKTGKGETGGTHSKDTVTQRGEEKETQGNRRNKLSLFLKKTTKKKRKQSTDKYNLSDTLFLFNDLKNYIILENRKHLFDSFTEQKFSSIIITPLNILPNVIIKKYFGIISLHIVKENVNLKQFDVFYQSIISDILFIAKSHIKAIGANLICSFRITNFFMREERSHAYALISICGDVAKI
ncbi:conserved Plasmodium protein, unknown function [Plasmodium knowlesi strain H]|uniref:C2 domain-containing protein n=3 Tax=Plasmodium knowlesi TaxID=5850 RepID=A0A5K1UVQ9_PLAKH|nr:conserved Plasmodium protein, unknown function [Plasmodium knowlesi strain H]OTN66788.1 Uncharacterized protein PKNOH_S08496100 [Plasmodium knowlesi]CAA9986770.1 conserved Plasmodium protein, unknown function [Plasmodium knowlesi strain H]SBO23602.1 conserved Plasmodium protein, unknown function [Plasmodium knowlesi strain H]SBO25159.1 conserved Plasmodium protein, unknown function [Plasmodium knowlesi strain H]VVS76244.1 conserved Plasmodium protein, unknown function [Plasmodium knowlesi s|eukprot:XP_002257954.1 hypothetical protein, conserved in Plasmodium species [Plasmodium knowlesi strain H]